MEEAEKETWQEPLLTVTLFLHFIASTSADRSLHAAYDWALSLGGKAVLRYVFISNMVLESRWEMQDWSSITFLKNSSWLMGELSELGQLEQFLILFLR